MRAELVLAPGDAAALADLDLRPDPLTPLVAALGTLVEGETATIALDLQPLSGAAIKVQRRKARTLDKGRQSTGVGGVLAALNTDPLSKGAAGGGGTDLFGLNSTGAGGTDLFGLGLAGAPGAFGRAEARADTVTAYDRFAAGNPVFAAQLLVWVDAPTKARARALVGALVAGLAPMQGRAGWRRTGLSVFGYRVGGAQATANRWRFDHRAATGCHHPVKPSIVGSREVAAFLKPPTRHCYAANVVRGGGVVPAPPHGLEDWEPGVPGLMPLGEVTESGVERIKGLPLESSFWSIAFGRTRSGKTEMGLVRMIAIARQPDWPEAQPANRRPGLLYLDPHGDGLDKLKPYLVDQADRVVEVNLADPNATLSAGWNPLDMTGKTAADIESVCSLMTAAYSAVLGWTGKNNRGLNLVTQATAALCQLGLQLPPHLQPTIFSIVTILDDEDWRKEILPFLAEHQRSFLSSRLQKQSDGDASTSPVTNLLDLMRVNRHMAALFGQPRSTFNLRECMDAGRIVLLSSGPGIEDYKRLIQCLFIMEMFRATTSRYDLVPAHTARRPMHAFVDELQVADRGSASAMIAMMLQEGAKFGLRGHFMVQQPTALQAETLRAFSTNVTHIFTNTVGAEDGPWLSKEFGGKVDGWTMLQLPRFNAIASVTHGVGGAARRTMPFRYRGLSVEKTFGPPASASDVAALSRTIDRTMGRRDPDEVVAALDLHDQRILLHLTGRSAAPRSSSPAGLEARRRRPPVAPKPPDARPHADGGLPTEADIDAAVERAKVTPISKASRDRASMPWRPE